MEQGKNQFIYVLRLAPRLRKEENWTDRDENAVERHFAKLKELLNEGKLLLAGKTEGLDDKTFGIVVFEAETQEEAEKIVRSAPAVSEGVMTAELFPYHVALMRKSL